MFPKLVIPNKENAHTCVATKSVLEAEISLRTDVRVQ